MIRNASVVECAAPHTNETACPEGGVVSVGLSFKFSGEGSTDGAEAHFVDIPVWGLYKPSPMSPSSEDVEHGLMFRYPGAYETCNAGAFEHGFEVVAHMRLASSSPRNLYTFSKVVGLEIPERHQRALQEHRLHVFLMESDIQCAIRAACVMVRARTRTASVFALALRRKHNVGRVWQLFLALPRLRTLCSTATTFAMALHSVMTAMPAVSLSVSLCLNSTKMLTSILLLSWRNNQGTSQLLQRLCWYVQRRRTNQCMWEVLWRQQQ